MAAKSPVVSNLTRQQGSAAHPGTVFEAVTETTPPPAAIDKVLALLEDLTRRQTAVEERLAAQEHAKSPFRPMGADDREIAAEQAAWPTPTPLGQGTREPGTTADGVHRQLPTTTAGHVLDEESVAEYPPRFRPGDFVRINPEARKLGETTQTWGQTLTTRKTQGIGKVSKIFDRRVLPDGRKMWKYQVRVKGLTPIQGDGFLEYELLPYERQRRPA